MERFDSDHNISGALAGSFGVAAGTFAIFFFGEIPRVRRDILMKVPFLDRYFDRTVAPEDNVSYARLAGQHGFFCRWKLIRASPSKSSAGLSSFSPTLTDKDI